MSIQFLSGTRKSFGARRVDEESWESRIIYPECHTEYSPLVSSVCFGPLWNLYLERPGREARNTVDDDVYGGEDLPAMKKIANVWISPRGYHQHG